MKKILVIQTASIGDVILTTPVLEKLHHFYPEAVIDLLVKEGMESLFDGHPFLHAVLTWNKKSSKYRNFFRLLFRVRRSSYDVVVNLQRFALTGLLTACSGANIRIGFTKNPFSAFFTHKIPHEIRDGVHEVDRNLRLIRDITGTGSFKPRLYPPSAADKSTAPYKASGYITISPASLWFTKQYPPEKWVGFLSKVLPGPVVFLLGSASDHPLCEGIARQSPQHKVINLAGKMTFLESASLMKDARMNFTNDSAPMHLASSVNAPVTVIYCSTVPTFGFGPLSEDSNIIESREKLDCRPCGLHGYKACPERHFRCALTIEDAQLSMRL